MNYDIGLTKFVEYDKWCKKCKHYKLGDSEDPCNECLTIPVNEHSHKPIKWEEKK